METHTPTQRDIWSYRDQNAAAQVATGFEVQALDGSIGKVDEASKDAGRGYIVVDTGPWIVGKKVLLPAGVVDRIDTNDEKVFVSCTKDQIKNAPEFDEKRKLDDSYRREFSGYYSPGGKGRGH